MENYNPIQNRETSKQKKLSLTTVRLKTTKKSQKKKKFDQKERLTRKRYDHPDYYGKVNKPIWKRGTLKQKNKGNQNTLKKVKTKV